LIKCLPIALLRIRTAPQKGISLFHYEMPYGLLTLALLLMYLPLKPKTISSKIICLDCPLPYYLLGKRGCYHRLPLHPHQPGDHVLIKTWKENKLEPAWEGLFLVLLTKETAFWTLERGGLITHR
jgi:hypothetical protein